MEPPHDGYYVNQHSMQGLVSCPNPDSNLPIRLCYIIIQERLGLLIDIHMLLGSIEFYGSKP